MESLHTKVTQRHPIGRLLALWARAEFIGARLLEFGSLSSSNSLPRKKIGQIGERIAQRYLKSQGYHLIEKNFRSARGEIDLVMTQAEELVFIEVKTRRSRYGGSIIFDSISNDQQAQLSKTAQKYIRQKLGKKWRGKFRFDAVGVVIINDRLAEIKVLRGFV